MYSTTTNSIKRHFLIWTLVIALLFTLTAPASASTVRAQTLAQGTGYETTLYIIESGKPGPVVLVTGGVHGDEPAGYQAAGKIKNWNITSGTLLVIPKTNQAAVKNQVRHTSAQKDFNRSFPTTKKDKADNILSAEIMGLLDTYQADWVLDLHEGYNYSILKSTESVGQSVIYYPGGNTYSIAQKIIKLHNQSITSSNKKFSLLKYPVSGSLARAAAVVCGAQSMILETCTKDPINTRINYHLNAVELVLNELKML